VSQNPMKLSDFGCHLEDFGVPRRRREIFWDLALANVDFSAGNVFLAPTNRKFSAPAARCSDPSLVYRYSYSDA